MPISIIIPAHNEETVIERCLKALTDGARPDEIDVVVVCNGCKDRTAEVARAFGKPVRVVETEVPSKSNALNLGDRAATGFPRFYVDADVRLSIESIRAVSKALSEGKVLAAAPLMKVDLSDRSWPVRAYYNIWLRLPYCRTGMLGSGIYAVSEAGRARFEAFPGITADDEFIRQCYAPDERLTVESCTFTIFPPKTLGGIISIFTRSHFGNIELRRRMPQIAHTSGSGQGGSLMRLALNPLLWSSIAVYTYVRVAVRLRAWWRYRFGDHRKWERDDTSREVPSAALPERP